MTKDEQTLADLKALLAFFKDPTNWTQGTYTHAKPEDPTKTCHCLAGGIMRIAGITDHFNTLRMLDTRVIRMRKALGFAYAADLFRWNDSSHTAHSSVLKRIRAAIKTLTPQKPAKRKYIRKSK